MRGGLGHAAQKFHLFGLMQRCDALALGSAIIMVSSMTGPSHFLVFRWSPAFTSRPTFSPSQLWMDTYIDFPIWKTSASNVSSAMTMSNAGGMPEVSTF